MDAGSETELRFARSNGSIRVAGPESGLTTQKKQDERSRDEMTTATTPKGAWGMTTLLFFYMLVNFADKIVVGLAAVQIMKDRGLTPEQLGLLGSAFFSLYAVSAIVVGIIADRVATKWILLVLGVIWAVV